MSTAISNVSDDNFEAEVLRAELPVLVDYWAPWCTPCLNLAPVLDEIAREYAGRLKVVKVNVDDSPDISAKYGVRGIPTLMIFKGGNHEGNKIGALSKSQLTAFIDSIL